MYPPYEQESSESDTAPKRDGEAAPSKEAKEGSTTKEEEERRGGRGERGLVDRNAFYSEFKLEHFRDRGTETFLIL